jgi:hypothetical protein
MKKIMLTTMLFVCISMVFATNTMNELPIYGANEVVEPSAFEGDWDGSIETLSGAFVFTMTYNVVGNTISGVMSSDYGDFEISKGTVTGNTFAYTLDFGDGATIIRHEGKLVSKDEILINSTDSAGTQSELTLTRSKK